jgi:hypothetical protein
MIALTGVLAPCDSGRVQAAPRTLAWTVVDTPADNATGMVIRPVGINDLALGVDGRTFYAVSTDNTTPNTGLFKSTDAGYTWSSVISNSLARAGAFFPVWNIAVAPDNVNFIVAITDNSSTAASGGPRMVYGSTDGGNSWNNWSTGLTLNANEYIRDIDISIDYGGKRDIGIVTANGAGGGRWFVRSSSPFSTWAAQTPPTTGIDYFAIKFPPTYADSSVALVYANVAATYYNVALRDLSANTTLGYAFSDPGIEVRNPFSAALSSPGLGTLRGVCLQLPSNFSASLRRVYISLNADKDASNQTGIYRIDDTTQYILRNTTAINDIYSIAYSGTYNTGILLAGEGPAYDPAKARAKVLQKGDAQATPPSVTWTESSLAWKLPTGGAGTGHANVLLAWSNNTPYCGTSSENATRGGTGWAAGQWPSSKLTKAPSDESAFQYSVDNGLVWNQIGIINTVISRLTDTAAYEQAEDEAGGDTGGNNALYLASINTGSPGFDSVWRSISDPLGSRWERILTYQTSDNGMILRINPRDESNGMAVVMADFETQTVFFSADEGNLWSQLYPGMPVNDISLLDDSNMYVLSDYIVRKLPASGLPGTPLNTDLLAPGHTICTSLNPSTGSDGKTQEIVVVGTGKEGENNDCYVAWADFNKDISHLKFTQLKMLPEQGDVHVVMDDLFESNKNIYAGITTTLHNDGNIYRWSIDTDTTQDMLNPVDNVTIVEHIKAATESINWDELDPLNRSFFGLCMLNDVFYGAWNTDFTVPLTSTGVDRTLEARLKVPPPPEWDELRDGLPVSLLYPKFTREPLSLHASSNSYNTLWAIDNQDYDFLTQQGCLWSYVDSVARLHPWPTAPPLGGFIGADPVTGRSQQIDFKWRPLKDIFGYDLLIAKDADFTLLLSREVYQALSMIPVDGLTGAWIVTPADQESPACWIAPGALEAGRPYYWRVRGSRTVENTTIHSPWSQAMFFSVKPGFRVTSDYMGPTLLAPLDGVCSNCKPPMRFSWSPIKNAKAYEFTLANDAQLKDVIVSYITHSTAYEYRGNLKPYKAYYWQVKAAAPVISDPSPVGTFSLAENNLSPLNALLSAFNSGAGLPGLWTWIIIVAVAALLFVILAYILMSRRRY